MAELDVDALLAEISPEAPCGPDLSYDPEFLQLDALASGKPERQVGTSILEAEEPDWTALDRTCRSLLARSKDIRVAMLLALAQLQLRGVPGLSDALRLVAGLVQKYWGSVHPQLDPLDDNDPMQRLNALSAFNPEGTFGDTMQFRKRLREAALVRSRRLGIFSLRDILVATGRMQLADPDAAKPDPAAIDGAFAEMTTEDLEKEHQAARAALDATQALLTALAESVGEGKTPRYEEFREILGEIVKQLNGYLVKRGAASATSSDDSTGGDGGTSSSSGPAINGEVRSTRDVVLALERCCEYYAKYEPSSPIPLLLRRAQRLVSKSFIEIMKDLTPGSLTQIDVISGVDSSSAPAE